jgi:hypothetical protein
MTKKEIIKLLDESVFSRNYNSIMDEFKKDFWTIRFDDETIEIYSTGLDLDKYISTKLNALTFEFLKQIFEDIN